MDRKKFLKSTLLAGVVGAVAPQVLNASNREAIKSTYDKLMQQVGFTVEGSNTVNHLPNKNNEHNEHSNT